MMLQRHFTRRSTRIQGRELYIHINASDLVISLYRLFVEHVVEVVYVIRPENVHKRTAMKEVAELSYLDGTAGHSWSAGNSTLRP